MLQNLGCDWKSTPPDFSHLTTATPTDEAPVNADQFPFLKLPLELRDRVYKHYTADLDTSWYRKDVHLHSFNRPGCDCPDYWNCRESAKPLRLSLCWTCKTISDEFLATFYKNKTIYFGCGCELREPPFPPHP